MSDDIVERLRSLRWLDDGYLDDIHVKAAAEIERLRVIEFDEAASRAKSRAIVELHKENERLRAALDHIVMTLLPAEQGNWLSSSGIDVMKTARAALKEASE